jgi:hypothetical protein
MIDPGIAIIPFSPFLHMPVTFLVRMTRGPDAARRNRRALRRRCGSCRFKGTGLASRAGVSFPIADSRENDSRLAPSALWQFGGCQQMLR